MNRRNLLKSLAALPLLGWIKPGEAKVELKWTPPELWATGETFEASFIPVYRSVAYLVVRDGDGNVIADAPQDSPIWEHFKLPEVGSMTIKNRYCPLPASRVGGGVGGLG